MVTQLSPEQLFDGLAIAINGPKAWETVVALDITFADLDVNYRLTLRNGVLVHRNAPADPATADAVLTVATKARLIALLLGGDVASPGIDISGDATVLQKLIEVVDQPDPAFNIVTP